VHYSVCCAVLVWVLWKSCIMFSLLLCVCVRLLSFGEFDLKVKQQSFVGLPCSLHEVMTMKR
jgi:phosphatidylserine synthase